MPNIERYEDPKAPIGILHQLEQIEKAGVLHLKGYRNSEIADVLDISPARAKDYVAEYLILLENKVSDDPYFLEKVQYNTLKLLNELDEISKEAWETVNIATNEGLVTARIQALKLTLETSAKRAQLLQLMGGGQKSESDHLVRTQKAESVNQILSSVLRDVVSDCENCRERARIMLAQAFSMMEEEATDAEVVEDAETIG